jgi:hypothetical protein
MMAIATIMGVVGINTTSCAGEALQHLRLEKPGQPVGLHQLMLQQ